MHREHLLSKLAHYKHSDHITPEELLRYDELISFIRSHPQCFERENPGHVTGSALVINHEMTHVLLTHHKKLSLWIQLGGHADGDPDIRSVSLREAYEESGIDDLSFVYDGIFDFDIHAIPTSCRMHYDIRYLIKAPPGAHYKISNESNDLAWVALNSISQYNDTRSIVRMIEKLQFFTRTHIGNE